MTTNELPGWFDTFRSGKNEGHYLRFRWWNDRRCEVYIGALGHDPAQPVSLLDAIVSKVMRMNGKEESPEQQDKHLEMLIRLRDMDKSWEAWEQRWNGG